MLPTRLIAALALVTAFLAGGLAATSPAEASLAATSRSGAAPAPKAPPGSNGKPHRHFIYAKIVRLPGGLLSFRAQVEDYPLGPIDLMKKNCKTCRWHVNRHATTTLFGRIFLPVGAPLQGRWYWRYRTPETAKYAVTFSSTWYTYTP